MFTGIISAVGAIVSSQALSADPGHGRQLVVAAPPDWLAGAALGDSIAINGACMTVTALANDGGHFSVDVSAESLACTAGLNELGRVNLEQAVRASDRLGGHLVSGHVDGVGRITAFDAVGESFELRIVANADLARFLAVKGSVTIQGVSLTVNRVVDRAEDCEFSINLIPHTLSQTNLGDLRVGAAVNLEIDLIARYVERMLAMQRQ
jgi:riboflavin synthase